MGIVCYVVVTPERLTPLLVRVSNEQLNADIQCETIDVTFFSTFPNMGIRLQNGYIAKAVADSVPVSDSVQLPTSDTLLYFSSCIISFNPMEYLKHDKLLIHEIHLDHPDIYAFVNRHGKANWEGLLPESGDSTATEITPDTSTFQLPELKLEQLRITDGRLVYNDRQTALKFQIEGFNALLTGEVNKDSAQLKLQLAMQTLSAWSNKQRIADNIPITFSTTLQQDLSNNRLQVAQAQLLLAGIEFDVNGDLQWGDTSNHDLHVNLHYNLHAPSIPKVLALVPSYLSAFPSRVSTAGEITLNGSVKGALGENKYPVLRANFQLLNGKLRSARHPNHKGIEQLHIESEAYIDLTNKTPSTFRLAKFFVQSTSINLNVSGEVNDLFKHPFLKTKIVGHVNFNRMAKYLLPDSLKAQGQIQMNMAGECLLADIMNFNYGKIKANGEINADSVWFNYPAQQLSVVAPFLRARFGSNIKDTSRRGRERDILFRGNIRSDSVNIVFGEMRLNADTLSVAFSTSKPKDTAAIAPIFANIRAQKLHVVQGDMQVKTHKAVGTALFASQRNNPTKPEYMLRFTLDSLNARTPDFSGRINNGKLVVRVKSRPQRVRRRTADTTATTGAVDTAAIRRRRLQRNLNNSAAGQAIVDMQLQSKEARTALRQWDVSGNLDLQGARLRTPYFPMRIQISEGALQFSTDSLYLKTLQLRLGRSSMNLSGTMHGIRQALLRNGILKADLSIDAKTINLNHLIRAMVAGSNYSAMDSTSRDSIATGVLNESVELAEVSDSASTTGVFVVPRNINFTLQAKIQKALYSTLELEDIDTKIFIRNQAIHLPEMKLRSNVGDMQLSFSYQAPDVTGAQIGATLALHHIHVKQLVETFPLFDSLTPMLRSFEGIVECNMATSARLDSLMNVDFTHTEASCAVKGNDLVLLDGETFSSIAKMLYFKNKQRNLIDSISVEMMLRNNYLMIFPFQLTMDRYQVAIGGTQYLNMDFDYHITVLKSPVPFKFGLNLKGNPDHMKIGLAKPLYKDITDPVKKQSLYGVLFNFRSKMEKKIKEDIEFIINREPVRRTPTGVPPNNPAAKAIDDSLRTFFISDTTGVPHVDSLRITN
jgi:hypothetical protein